MSKAKIAMGRSRSVESVVVIDIGGTHVRCGGAHAGNVLADVRQFSTDIFETGDPVSTLEQTVRSFAAGHGLHDFDLVVGIPATLGRSAAVHGAMHLILKRGKAPGIADPAANLVSKRA